VEWFGVGFFSVFDAFVAYEDFDAFQAIMASNQAQDEEIWAQNRSSQDRTNQQLVRQKILAGRYTPAPDLLAGKDNIRPSWAEKYGLPRPGESGKDFADRLCRAEFGPNGCPDGKGPGSDHSKLKKWADRRPK
jgi:hypothetical protein